MLVLPYKGREMLSLVIILMDNSLNLNSLKSFQNLVASPLPSAQNNSHAKVAYLGEACPEPPHRLVEIQSDWYFASQQDFLATLHSPDTHPRQRSASPVPVRHPSAE